MRLKLVLIASLMASMVGAGAAIAIILFFTSSLSSLTAPSLFVATTYLLPALAVFFASMFVYRHTARRRKLHATLTVLVSLILTLTIFLSVSMITSRSAKEQPPPAPPRGVG